MIDVRIFKRKTGEVYGFTIKNHGNEIVCAAVSILAQNTVNSVEKFTDGAFKCEHDESGGYIFFEHEALKNGGELRDAALLLKSMVLGLEGIRDVYKNEIKITTEVKNVKD